MLQWNKIQNSTFHDSNNTGQFVCLDLNSWFYYTFHWYYWYLQDMIPSKYKNCSIFGMVQLDRNNKLRFYFINLKMNHVLILSYNMFWVTKHQLRLSSFNVAATKVTCLWLHSRHNWMKVGWEIGTTIKEYLDIIALFCSQTIIVVALLVFIFLRKTRFIKL